MFRSYYCVPLPPSLIVEGTYVRSRAFSENLWKAIRKSDIRNSLSCPGNHGMLADHR